MALNKITILNSGSGLNRPQSTNDGVSGFLFISSAATDVTITQAKITDPTQLDEFFGITATATTEAEGAVIKYHVEEYFRFSDSPVYIQFVLSTSDYSEINSLKDFSKGAIKQLGVFNADDDISSVDIQFLQGEAEKSDDEFAPMRFGFSAALTGTAEAAPTVKTENAPNVCVLIAQDLTDDSEAKRLFDAAYHVGAIGTFIGLVSQIPVHQSVAYVSASDLRGGGGWQDPGFTDGAKVTETTLVAMNAISENGYVFTRDYVGGDVITFTKALTAEVETSDFSLLQIGRVFDKASRTIYTALLPQLDAPLFVDDSGKLQAGTIAFFKNLAGSGLQVMKNVGEISSFSVSIDSSQDVISTSKLEIGATIIPVGSASEIEVKLGFSTSLS